MLVVCCGAWSVSHPQPPLSGTGVLWVLTRTNRCDDPPRQGGGSPERQLVRALLLRFVLLHCGSRLRVSVGVIFRQTTVINFPRQILQQTAIGQLLDQFWRQSQSSSRICHPSRRSEPILHPSRYSEPILHPSQYSGYFSKFSNFSFPPFLQINLKKCSSREH